MFTRTSSQKLDDWDGYNGLFNKRGMVERLMVGVEQSILVLQQLMFFLVDDYSS